MTTFDMNNATDEALSYEGRKHHKLPKRLEYGYELIGKIKKSS